MKLYHYVHCPFCIRVRMALGFLKINFTSVPLPYNDELTPINLTGVKMLPIFEFSSGAQNESLDIIRKLDEKDLLNCDLVLNNQLNELETLIDTIGKDVHNLAMPYWIWTPEFDEDSRKYFESKKSKKRGPFKELVWKRKEFINSLNQTLESLETKLSPFYNNNKFDLADIIIASHLWGMYIVPEFQFSPTMHQYLQNIAKICNFNYHEDFWR